MYEEQWLKDDEGVSQLASELAETLEGMSLYTLRLATSPECPRTMTSELSLVRAALQVCIARADSMANWLDKTADEAG